MPTYRVNVEYSFDTTVEAENEEHAKDLAYDDFLDSKMRQYNCDMFVQEVIEDE